MLLRVVSDLHLEFTPLDLPSLPSDVDTTLVLAGDIGNFTVNGNVTMTHFKKWASQFKHVVYVLGNHDYYHDDLQSATINAKDMLSDLDNVHILDKHAVEIDDVCFIGATLWTDFKNGDNGSMNFCEYAMADYKYINNSGMRVTPQDTLREHQHAKFFIFDRIKQATAKGLKPVVVTHHLPSYQSVHPFYAGSELNCAFASNLDADIEFCDALLWIHGHTHYCFDYKIANTRIFCNPRGYVIGNRIENANFNPTATIDLGDA